MADAFSDPFVEISHVETSTPSSTLQLTPLAGTACGIAREGETVSYYDTTHEEERCLTGADLHNLDELELDNRIDGAETTDSDRADPEIDYGPPVADHMDPLP
jgi:hypothetical protein